MPANKPKRPEARARMVAQQVGADLKSVDRAIAPIADAVSRLDGATKTSSIVVVSLVVGANRVAHNLGRKPRAANVTPTVADATFAWALTAADDKLATITVVGVAQPNAAVEVSA